jgi:hypothetical protein
MERDDDRKIKEKVERTIAALEDIETIEGNPFLYTRIKAHLNSQPERSRFGFISVLVSPLVAMVITLVAVNLLSAMFFLSKHSPTVRKRDSFIVSLTDDYYVSADDDMFSNMSGRE